MFWFNNIWYIKTDLNLIVRLYLTRLNNEHHTWRNNVLYLAHALPAFAVSMDMIQNRLRIPWHHVLYNMLFLALYMLITYCYEVYQDYEAIFAHSLNWACKADWSFRYFSNTT